MARKSKRQLRTKHHRIPEDRGGTDHPSNIVLLPDDIHRAWHRLFRQMTPLEVFQAILDHWVPSGLFGQMVVEYEGCQISLDTHRPKTQPVDARHPACGVSLLDPRPLVNVRSRLRKLDRAKRSDQQGR